MKLSPERIKQLSDELPDELSNSELWDLVETILKTNTTLYRLQKIHKKITGKTFDA